MSSSQHGLDSMAYRPTSLDFINRPNPVEPHTQQEKHPLNGTPRLERTANNQAHVRLLLHRDVNRAPDDVERPAKRRKSGGGLDLPSLPMRTNTKRLRIPPTLSGLHQPPPDAGILPSMSVEQPRKMTQKAIESMPEDEPASKSLPPPKEAVGTPIDKGGAAAKPTSAKPKRNKWSEEETSSLLKGVARFGIGSWTKILNCKEYDFPNRTALDLKDRFRVCRPDDYVTNRKSKKTKNASKDVNSTWDQPTLAVELTKDDKSERKSAAELSQLGIDAPFEKSSRRKRTNYTPAEDEALLRGFQRHGNSWASIRQDPQLGLSERTAMDLRDRFRTRFPSEYKAAGLTGRPEEHPKKLSRNIVQNATSQDEKAFPTSGKPVEPATQSRVSSSQPGQAKVPDTTGTEKSSKMPTISSTTDTPYKKSQPPTSLLDNSDVFWGCPFDNEVEAEDIEPPTLDRRILDCFPASTNNHVSNLDGSKGATIDPLATLNLPYPTATTSSQAANAWNPATLPSVADITAGHADDDWTLPSLMALAVPGAFAQEPLRENHFPGWDELLS